MVTFGSVAYLETSAFKDLSVHSGVGGSFFVEKKCEIVVIKLYMQKTGYSRFLVEKHSQYFNP